MRIIDFHTHVFPRPFREDRARLFPEEPAFRAIYASPKARLVGVGELMAHMDRHGIERAVIFGFPWEHEALYRRHNDYVAEAAGRYPQRLTAFCCFSPQAAGAARETARCLEGGVAGVGELALYGSDLDAEVAEALAQVMFLCREKGAPVLLHTNEPVGHNYPGKAPMTLASLYALIKRYPHNRIILAHWGGGLFFYAAMRKEVREVLRNVWFDTAASPFLYEARIYRLAGELVGYDKILLGSDYPLLPAVRYLREMAAAGLTPDRVARIARGNAAALLGLKD